MREDAALATDVPRIETTRHLDDAATSPDLAARNRRSHAVARELGVEAPLVSSDQRLIDFCESCDLLARCECRAHTPTLRKRIQSSD